MTDDSDSASDRTSSRVPVRYRPHKASAAPRLFAWLAALLVAGAIGPQEAAGQLTEGVLSVLQPGSRLQYGLGGDPFLSPLADEVGWWDQFDPRVNGQVSWRANLCEPFSVTATGRNLSLRSQHHEFLVERQLMLDGRELRVHTSVEVPRSRLAILRPDGYLFMTGTGWNVEETVRWEALQGAVLQVQVPIWRETPSGSSSRRGAGLRLVHFKPLSFQGTYVETRRGEKGNSLLLSEPIPFDLNAKAARQSYDLRLALSHSAQVESSVSETRLTPIQETQVGEGYEFTPEGKTRTHQWSISWRFSRAGRAILRGSWLSAEVEASAKLAGMRFGRLSYLKAEEQSWLAAVDWATSSETRLLFECESARFSASVNGYIESWPFTSALGDLLGIQQNVRATAQGRLFRLHGAISRRFGAGTIQGGINGYRIDPTVRAMTWQPAFLGMGWRDLHRYGMESAYATMGAVSLGLAFPLPLFGCEVSLGVQQFAYAKLTGSLKEDAGMGPPAQAHTGSNGGRGRGGTFLDFRLLRRL